MLPAPLAGRGGAFVIVNSTGTALATSLPSVVFGSPGPIGAKTPSTGNFTTLTAIGEVLAGSLAVLGISLGEFPQQVTIETGLPIPSAARPVGSIYIRKDGGIGTTLYISRGAGTWRAVAGV
jgi:hypothetical protein